MWIILCLPVTALTALSSFSEEDLSLLLGEFYSKQDGVGQQLQATAGTYKHGSDEFHRFCRHEEQEQSLPV